MSWFESWNVFKLVLGSFPGGASGKESTHQQRRPERQVQSLGQEDFLVRAVDRNPLQLNSMGRRAWRATSVRLQLVRQN